MKTSVLVTGGSGFIGTHLCRRLRQRGAQVRVLDLVHPTNPVEGVEYIQGDVRDPQAVEKALAGVQHVFHFAAVVSVPVCQTQPMLSQETNLHATVLLLETIRKKAEKTGEMTRILFASTAALYGNQGSVGKPLSETDVAAEPPSFYAAQKLGSEYMIRLFHQQFGIPAVVFRFFNVFGPGQDPTSPYSGVITVFLNLLKKNLPLRLNGGGTQTRDFISVYDIAAACEKGMDIPASLCNGEAMNLGTGKAITIRELAETMIQGSKSSVKTEDAPPRSGDVIHSLASPSRAEKVLGWKAVVSLENGLKELF